MQCPNCGFENIPGRTVCGVCSTSLVKPPERESVIPDRARDRTLGQSIRWSIERTFRRRVPEPTDLPHLLPPMQAARQLIPRCLAVLVSIVPGLGFVWSGSWKPAAWSALGAVVCAVLGVLYFKTRALDLAALSIAALSVMSIIACMEWAFPPTGDASARMHRRVGRGLMAVSALTVVLMVGFLAPFSHLSLFYVPRDLPEVRLSADDRVLTVVASSYRKGDIVLCADGNLAVIDVMPGGWASDTFTDGTTAQRRVKSGEYGLRYIQWYRYGTETGTMIRPGIRSQSLVRSRLTIIYNPPARRGWIRPAMYP